MSDQNGGRDEFEDEFDVVPGVEGAGETVWEEVESYGKRSFYCCKMKRPCGSLLQPVCQVSRL